MVSRGAILGAHSWLRAASAQSLPYSSAVAPAAWVSPTSGQRERRESLLLPSRSRRPSSLNVRRSRPRFDGCLLKKSPAARSISYPQTSGEPSNPMPLPRASGGISLHWRETSGSVGSHRPGRKSLEDAASMSALISCVEACAGRAVGLGAHTAEVRRPGSLPTLSFDEENAQVRSRNPQPVR